MLQVTKCNHYRCKGNSLFLCFKPQELQQFQTGAKTSSTCHSVNGIYNTGLLCLKNVHTALGMISEHCPMTQGQVNTLQASNTGLFEMIVRVLTTCHKQYTWDRRICIFLFNRTTLQVFVTYLIGALYVHPLWFYKHQHDNRGRSKLFVAFNVHRSVHHINILLYIIPTRYTSHRVYFWHCSTCFGRHYYPSSGAQNNCNYSIW